MKGLKIVLGALCCTALCSCFKDEPLNSECDVEQAYIHADNPTALFFNVNDTLVNVLTTERNIKFKVLPGADLTALTPHFRVTEGATVRAADGSAVDAPHDFSGGKSVAYTVTSQDGQWSKTYTVSMTVREDLSVFDFENFSLSSEYAYRPFYEWKERNAAGELSEFWATGNAGFDISMGEENEENHVGADQFPTVPIADGYEGHGVKLTTCDTGPFGTLVNMRIAAGNLFSGRFNVDEALGETMKTTMFGQPMSRKPVKFIGYYKYKPGKDFQNRMGEIQQGVVDKGDIYCVVYRNVDGNGQSVVLDGNNIRSSSLIVGTAIIDEVKVTDKWTRFEIPFTYTKDIDPAILAAHGYNLAIVFTSSYRGASFEGAVGSTLWIDSVKLIWDDDDDDDNQ